MREQTRIGLLNPLDPDFRENPHKAYDQLRSADPICRETDLKRILFTRAEDIAKVLNNRDIGCDPRKTAPGDYLRRVFRVDETFKPSMLRMDDPDHKRVP